MYAFDGDTSGLDGFRFQGKGLRRFSFDGNRGGSY
jgi:hypothetical protein